MTVIPAFPSDGHSSGMTLRDYFAAKAMQALISAYPCQAMHDEEGGIPIERESIAYEAYAMADEMIRTRDE